MGVSLKRGACAGQEVQGMGMCSRASFDGALRAGCVLFAGLLLGVLGDSEIARGEGTHSLDSVPVAEPVGLDSLPQAESVSLDAVPVAKPTSLDSLPSGKTRSPDAFPSAQPADLNRVPHAEPESLDAAETPSWTPSDAETQGTSLRPQDRAAFTKAGKALSLARGRLEAANAAYSKMMARGYPRGEAKAAIIQERDRARSAAARAASEYRALGGEVPAAQGER